MAKKRTAKTTVTPPKTNELKKKLTLFLYKEYESGGVNVYTTKPTLAITTTISGSGDKIHVDTAHEISDASKSATEYCNAFERTLLTGKIPARKLIRWDIEVTVLGEESSDAEIKALETALAARKAVKK